jgi:hypothetical protein
MRGERPSLIETLVLEEIRRVVADAIRDGGCLVASAAASQILRTYKNCGLAEHTLVIQVAMAAAKSGVAVELNKRRPHVKL